MATIKSYVEAAQFLGNKSRKKLENNTYLERRDPETIAVKLHNTDVVTYTPGAVELKTGGWQTVTTKDRLNTYGPLSVYQRKGEWYIVVDGKEQPFGNGYRLKVVEG